MTRVNFSDAAEPAASDECTAEYACGVHHRGRRIAPLESARELNDMFATRRHRAHATVGLCAARNVWSSFDVHCAWALCIRDMHINPCYDSSSNIGILGQKPEVEIRRPKNISFVMGLFWQKAGFCTGPRLYVVVFAVDDVLWPVVYHRWQFIDVNIDHGGCRGPSDAESWFRAETYYIRILNASSVLLSQCFRWQGALLLT